VNKKNVLLCSALALAFSLSACGGGGGGLSGPGSHSANFYAGISGDGASGGDTLDTTGAKDPDITAAALADNTDIQAAMKGAGIPITAIYSFKGHILKVDSQGSVVIGDLFGKPVATFTSIDPYSKTVDGVTIDFAVMRDTPKDVSQARVDAEFDEPEFSGVTAKETNALWLGKLEHANFGYWVRLWDAKGTYDSTPFSGTLIQDGAFFHYGNQANYDTSLDGATFTGVAAGAVNYIDPNANGIYAIPLMGTARLDVVNASDGTLVLDFPQFYKFEGSVATSASGEMTGQFDRWTQNAGYSLSVSLPATPGGLCGFCDNEINGQLYGDASTNPTEAAGSWIITHEPGSLLEMHIGGVFGVKKNP